MKEFALAVLVAAFAFTGCSKKNGDGPSVEGSVKIDLDEEKEALEKNLKKAGEEIKEGAEVAKEKLTEAGEAINDKVEEAIDKLSDDKKATVEIEVKKD